jgi:heptose I phosphotransferase
MGLTVNEGYLRILKENGLDSFDRLMNYKGGSAVKKKEIRDVVRIALGGRVFFLKRHRILFRERLARFLPYRFAEDARNEWEKMGALAEAGFLTATPVAYGENGGLALTLTEELYEAVRLEDFIPTLAEAGIEGVLRKRQLIRRLAFIVRRFHDAGFNHQDLYLCHIFTRPATGEIFFMDLQRVQKRNPPARRWIRKDLAQFIFSAKGSFSSTDLVRFGHAYLGRERFDKEDKTMIKAIFSKAKRIARHDEKLRATGRP